MDYPQTHQEIINSLHCINISFLLCLSLHLTLFLSLCPCPLQPFCLSVCLPVCLPVSLSACLSACLVRGTVELTGVCWQSPRFRGGGMRTMLRPLQPLQPLQRHTESETAVPLLNSPQLLCSLRWELQDVVVVVILSFLFFWTPLCFLFFKSTQPVSSEGEGGVKGVKHTSTAPHQSPY